MRKTSFIFSSLLALIVLIIYFPWFFHRQIIGGDWPYFYQENVNSFIFLPSLWNALQGGGLGGVSYVFALDGYLYFTGALFSQLLHIPWIIIYKIVWYGMFLFLSTLSIISLCKEIFSKPPMFVLFFSMFIYLTNTYILIVVGGGQMGVALGYALLPLVLVRFMKVIKSFYDNQNNRLCLLQSLIAGLLVGLQIMFDYRVAYLTLVGITLYFFINLQMKYLVANKKKLISLLLFTFILPGLVTLLLHVFWLLPILYSDVSPVTQLGSAYTTTSAVTFFSFAKFENALVLLHPYWPENVFGKVGFMKPEFLLIPVLAFSSLLFIISKAKKKTEQYAERSIILFFALLALLSAFLAKGTNDPFGGLYLWMFSHIPGFVMFRDPTKWYMLIAIAYSVLIPFTIWKIYAWLSKNSKFKLQSYLPKLFLVLVVCYLLFLIRPALLGKLNGTFALHTVPSEYISLKNTLVNQKKFARTLWLPRLQRYGFVSSEHPFIEGYPLFNDTSTPELIKSLQQKNTESKLAMLSVGYVIVPFDSEHEIFLKNRDYDESQMKILTKELDTISWLKRDRKFKKMYVYKVSKYSDHFALLGKGALSYQKISDTEYTLNISSSKKNTLVFSENYNPYWETRIGDHVIKSKPYDNLNSYQLPAINGENVKIKVFFSLTKYYVIGSSISLATLLIVIVTLLILHKKRKQYEEK